MMPFSISTSSSQRLAPSFSYNARWRGSSTRILDSSPPAHYPSRTWMLDSSEGVCAGQAWFEYPAATFVLLSRYIPHGDASRGDLLRGQDRLCLVPRVPIRPLVVPGRQVGSDSLSWPQWADFEANLPANSSVEAQL
jgi:hypothetical protein